MMPREILLEILEESIIQNHDEVTSFDLKETDRTAKLKKITLTGIPNNSIILNLDKFSSNTLFKASVKKGKYDNCRCDYVIVTNEKCVFFIEMKSDVNSPNKKNMNKKCIGQYKASRCLLVYIDAIITDMYQQNKIFASGDNYYILLYSSALPPHTSASLKSEYTTSKPNNTPENFLAIPVVNGGVLSFEELISQR